MISQSNLKINLGAFRLGVDSASLDIEDGRTNKMQNGRVIGELDGPITASGELVVDARNLAVISKAALVAGSFEKLPTFKINFFAQSGDEKWSLVAYGCRLTISSLLSASPNESADLLTTLPFRVTSPRLVDINGIPYADQEELSSLIPALKAVFLSL